MQFNGRYGRRGGVVLAMFAALGIASAGATVRNVRVELGGSGFDDDARGYSRLSMRSSSDGRFDVSARRLDRNASYELIVDGVKVGTLHTNNSGSGRIRFRTQPRRRDLRLGFDPRGATLIIQDDHGNDVLAGDVPDDDVPGAGACCDAEPEDDGHFECERRTPAQCAERGGTFLAGVSCLPNPCGGTPPPAGDVVCCLPDDGDRPECEDRTETECLAQGGIVVAGGSCDPNPCAPTPAPGDIQCCLSDDSGAECEDRTPAECAAQGGVDMGAGMCAPGTCATTSPPGAQDIQCCLPDDSGIECEDRTPAECAAQGGVDMGPGTCLPDPCAD
jgi:hypothetical protein